MNADVDITEDLEALKAIAADTKRLRTEASQLRESLAVRERGYFRPDEEDQARRLWLTYRNHRRSLYEIIFRHENHVEDDRGAFLLAFGAAIHLYSWSSYVIACYDQVPVIRAKLNERDTYFGLEPGLFDAIYAALRSPQTVARLLDAARTYHESAAEFADLGPEWQHLVQLIDGELPSVEAQAGSHCLLGARAQLRDMRQRLREQLASLRDHLQPIALGLVGNVWFGRPAAIPRSHRESLRDVLEPGDIMIVRPDNKSSTALLPGWWTHAAVYHGGATALEALKVDVDWRWDRGVRLVTAEALAAGVVVNTLERTLRVNHVVVLRPQVSLEQKRAVLRKVLRHVGKPYDFSFDFKRSDCLVCTELVYRSYDQIGSIRLELVPRMGNPTLSADDLVRHALLSPDQFAMSAVSLAHDGGRFALGEEARDLAAATLGLS